MFGSTVRLELADDPGGRRDPLVAVYQRVRLQEIEQVGRRVDGRKALDGPRAGQAGPFGQHRFAVRRQVAQQAMRQSHDRLVLITVRSKRALGDPVGVVGEEHSFGPDDQVVDRLGRCTEREWGEQQPRRPARPPSRRGRPHPAVNQVPEGQERKRLDGRGRGEECAGPDGRPIRRQANDPSNSARSTRLGWPSK